MKYPILHVSIYKELFTILKLMFLGNNFKIIPCIYVV
jgi:hypothetical protein